MKRIELTVAMSRKAILSAAIVVALSLPVFAQDASTTSQATTEATFGPTIVREPLTNFQAINQLNNVRSQLTLDAGERTLMGAVQDYDADDSPEPFLYAMLAKMDKVADVDPKFFPIFDRPSFPSMVLDPAQYRMQPIRLTVLVFSSTLLTQENRKIKSNSRWPVERPVWRLTGKIMGGYEIAYESLIIYTTDNPEQELGQPNKIENGESLYGENGRKMEILCSLYKVVRMQDRNEDEAKRQTFNYPVVVAWQIVKPESLFDPGAKSGGVDSGYTILMVIIVLMLGAAFFIFLRFARQAKTRASRFSEVKDAKKMYSGSNDPDREVVDGPVDPALKEAAEMFFKEHGEPDARNKD